MSTEISWLEVELDIAYRNVYPASDVTAGSWTIPPLWSKLDSPDSLDQIASSGPSYAEMNVGTTFTPGLGTSSIVITARKTTNSPNTLIVTLVEGATVRATWTITDLNTTFTQRVLELTPTEVASIVEWPNLRVRISHPEGS